MLFIISADKQSFEITANCKDKFYPNLNQWQTQSKQ
jgi:hypothetical protein